MDYDEKRMLTYMKHKNRPFGLFRSAVLLTIILSMLLATGCQALPAVQTEAPTEAPTQAAETESSSAETEPAPTEPPETEPEVKTLLPDGNPNDVTCKGSYSADDISALRIARSVVATAGEAELTNAQLQIYYWMAVNTYRAANHEIAPNFDEALDAQICTISNQTITWQQYFLQSALDTWHSWQSMTALSESYVFETEEAYSIMEDKHAENISEGMAVLEYLYGYCNDYTIDEQHQAFLDTLPTLLDNLAVEKGYEDLSALVQELAGIATSDNYLLDYAELCNRAYMLFAEMSYYVEPSEEEVTAWFEAHAGEYKDAGITQTSGRYVNIRQILVSAESGSKNSAQSILNTWKKYGSEVYFGELAYKKSDDAGSYGNGGLYTGLRQGQLAEELDAWCFDEARVAGDTTIIETEAGSHILYFSGSTDIWYAEAEADLIADTLGSKIDAARELFPMDVEYSEILLADAAGDSLPISLDEILYPDVAHERFSVAPLYLQQDYGDTKYGNYSLKTYGCGITTMSMLVSYMLDEEWTPPEMCEIFGSYCGEKGTAHTLFLEAPSKMGFYAIDKVSSWSEALEALKEGHMVITLQHGGFWTSKGHYVLLHNLVGEDQVTVRDSNLYNYGKLEGHQTGIFDLDTVPANAAVYWIYQKKVLTSATCSRCGHLTEAEEGKIIPSAMFREDYNCAKCREATARRNAFMDYCG